MNTALTTIQPNCNWIIPYEHHLTTVVESFPKLIMPYQSPYRSPHDFIGETLIKRHITIIKEATILPSVLQEIVLSFLCDEITHFQIRQILFDSEGVNCRLQKKQVKLQALIKNQICLNLSGIVDTALHIYLTRHFTFPNLKKIILTKSSITDLPLDNETETASSNFIADIKRMQCDEKDRLLKQCWTEAVPNITVVTLKDFPTGMVRLERNTTYCYFSDCTHCYSTKLNEVE